MIISKKEFKILINSIYPSKSHCQSCRLCAKDTEFSFETIYKSCNNENYPVSKSLYKTLNFKKELKDILARENNLRFDQKCIKAEKEEIGNKLNIIKNNIQNYFTDISNKINDLQRKIN